MSLLNDMLRDLSHHKPIQDGNEGYQKLVNSASFSQKKHLPWGALSALFVVVFGVVLAINYALHTLMFNGKPNDADAISSENSASVTRQLPDVAVPDVMPASDRAPRNNTETTPTQAVSGGEKSAAEASVASVDKSVAGAKKSANSDELNNHISDLFLQAERAIGMDRLTAPIEDNAYSYYQKILSLDASNDDAKNGLDEIAKRYITKAHDQLASGNSQAAEALMQRARFVSSRYVAAHEINAYDGHEVVSGEDGVTTDAGNAQFSTQDSMPVETMHVEPMPVETIKSFEVAEANQVIDAKNISVTPNAGWKDEQLAQYAQDLLKKNKQTEAQQALKKFIAQENAPILSATLLADIYMQQGNTEAAGIIAEQATYLPIDTKAKINAQILSANNDFAQAIAILEKNLTAAENNEAYRALLASLYHKTASYQQSITSYQRLLTRFGDKPSYWLGLALAYDGLSQYQNALQAYLRLREFPQLQEQVIVYADQRIAALRSEQ